MCVFASVCLSVCEFEIKGVQRFGFSGAVFIQSPISKKPSLLIETLSIQFSQSFNQLVLSINVFEITIFFNFLPSIGKLEYFCFFDYLCLCLKKVLGLKVLHEGYFVVYDL